MNTNLLRGWLPQLALALVLFGLFGCAQTTGDTTGVGTVQFALTGKIDGVNYLTLSIYDGPVTDITAQSPTFQPLACAKYEGAVSNRIKLQYLKASSNYTLFVEMFGDSTCQKRVGFAWRGNVEVVGGNDLADVVPTYYIQPYLLGQFTGLAPAPPMPSCKADADCNTQLSEKCGAGKCVLSCNNDGDCKSYHQNATCKASSCVLENLFPLNGSVPRGFASSLPLADGSVAVFGGLTVLSNGNWTATSKEAEVFDPLMGYFRSVAGEPLSASPDFTAVGLATAVTDGAQAVAVVGGSVDTSFVLDPGKTLTTTLDTKGCPNACPIANSVQRWDLASGAKTNLALATSPPGFMPIVSRVHRQSGDRLLIAGGTDTPINKTSTFDSRHVNALLCDLSSDVITCTASKNSMGARRANAASACLTSAADGTCIKVFILGGRLIGSPMAEVYDAETDTFPPVGADSSVNSLALHGGKLFKLPIVGKEIARFLLLGASTQAPFIEGDVLAAGGLTLQPPTIVTVNSDSNLLSMKLEAAPLGSIGEDGKRLLATTVALRDGSSLLIGGLDETLLPAKTAVKYSPQGVPTEKYTLAARVGATASLLGGQTPLAGCVLLAGGFTTDPSSAVGALIPQNHVEVFCPSGL